MCTCRYETNGYEGSSKKEVLECMYFHLQGEEAVNGGFPAGPELEDIH